MISGIMRMMTIKIASNLNFNGALLIPLVVLIVVVIVGVGVVFEGLVAEDLVAGAEDGGGVVLQLLVSRNCLDLLKLGFRELML